MDKLHRKGIMVMGCFAFGSDEDGPDVFKRTVELCLEAKIDLPRFSIITPFPGTPFYSELDAQGRIIERDFAMYDVEHCVYKPKQMTKEELEENFAVCANLPYYITTPIIMAFIENKLPFKSITVLVQKEVAQRMAAKANTPEYGSLSCAVQYYTRATLCSKVPPSCFYPAPKVSSQVIRLERLSAPAADVDNEGLFLKLIRAAFAMRRKTLANNLIQAFDLTRQQAEEVIEASGIKKDIRGEALDIKQLA